MAKQQIWYVGCPVCRRRYPVSLVLRTSRGDFSVYDYPAQAGVSLGSRGFAVTDYYGWARIGSLPSETREALFIFLQRIENTHEFVKQLQLLAIDDYVGAYLAIDDFTVAYGLREAK